MGDKIKVKFVDNQGKVTQKGRLFITARPALFRWVIKKDGKEQGHTYFRRTGYDEYLELSPQEKEKMLDYLRLTEKGLDELTIDKVDEILSKPHIVAPDKMVVTPEEHKGMELLREKMEGDYREP